MSKTMMKKAIIFTDWFEAPDELITFCKSIGYQFPNFTSDWDLRFDERVIEFCEKDLVNLWGDQVYRGRENWKFRVGFAGAGHIRTIDTSRTWRITYNNVDAPVIEYIDVQTNKYGRTIIVPSAA